MATAPVILRVMDGIAERLASIEVPDGGTALFGGDHTNPQNWNTPAGPRDRPTRIYFQGEPLHRHEPPYPLVVVRFDDPDPDELSTLIDHFAGFVLEVHFDHLPGQEGHPDRRAIHAHILAQVRDAFGTDAGRRLPVVGFGATAVETTFQAGGAALTPIDEDAESDTGPAAYAFRLRYLTRYRHAADDARTIVS